MSIANRRVFSVAPWGLGCPFGTEAERWTGAGRGKAGGIGADGCAAVGGRTGSESVDFGRGLWDLISFSVWGIHPGFDRARHGGERFDADHPSSSANRERMTIRRVGEGVDRLRGARLRAGHMEKSAAQNERFLSASIGQETEVADAAEALGLGVKEESADELRSRENHLAAGMTPAVVVVGEGDPAPIEADWPGKRGRTWLDSREGKS